MMRIFRRLLQILVSIGLIELFSQIAVSAKIGSSVPAFFSATHCFAPLIGVISGVSGSSLLCVIRTIVKIIFIGHTSNILLVYNIPSFCAALYFALLGITLDETSSRSIVRKVAACLIPVTCMILFIAHPTGLHAFPYTFYWFIPIITALMPHSSFFLHALGSTFTAHAVGSVLWLYCKSIPAAAWLGLIPVVFVERIVFALGMVVCYYAARSIKTYMIVPLLRYSRI